MIVFLATPMILTHRVLPVLELVHRAGWVHRDISSGNIFISKTGVVKLGDFEYAKRLRSTGEEDGDIRTVCPPFCVTVLVYL